MKKIAAVIFDMDGVIVDSNPVHKKVLHEFCDKYGKELSDEYIREKLFGRTNREWIPMVFGSLTDERVEALSNEKERMFRDLFNPKEHVVPGFVEFLDRVKQHDIPAVVATSAPKENTGYILGELSVTGMFDAVLHMSHFTNSKPHPEPYLKAAKAADASPRDCIVFEDSISGIKSGLSAGCSVVGVATTHTHGELNLCHLVVDDFRDPALTLPELQKLVSKSSPD